MSQRQLASVLLAVLAIMIVTLVGVGLVMFRDRIADRLFSAAPSGGQAAGIQAVALSVLGVYFVINSIPDIMWQGA